MIDPFAHTAVEAFINSGISPGFGLGFSVGAVPLYHPAGSDVWFPVERIPDGSIWFFHHHWWGLLLALLAMHSLGRNERPVRTMAGILTSVSAWAFMWHNAYAPFTGALLSLAGVTYAIVQVVIGPYWAERSYAWAAGRVKAAALWVWSVGPVTAAVRSARRVWAGARAVPSVVRSAPGAGVMWVLGIPIRVWWAVTNPIRAFYRTATPRRITMFGLLVAWDDVVDHSLPVTSLLQRVWADGGHERSTAIAGEVARLTARWLSELLALLG